MTTELDKGKYTVTHVMTFIHLCCYCCHLCAHPATKWKTPQKSFQEEVFLLRVFQASYCWAAKYSQGAVPILFVLLCMDSITSCVAAASLCIQLTDQRRLPVHNTPVHSKNKHGRDWAMSYVKPFIWCTACGLIRVTSLQTVTWNSFSFMFHKQ